MTIKAIRNSMNPFTPFSIKLSDGSNFHVPHADYIMFPPNENHIIIGDKHGGIHLINVEHIVSFSYESSITSQI